MTNKELKEKIALLETELTEVKEKVKELKNSIDDGGVFKPEDGQEYWRISGSGDVYRNTWNNDLIDHSYYAIGNCSPTKQSAEDTVRVLKLIRRARESQGGFVPDWKDSKQQKCFLYFQMGEIGVADYPSINVAPIFGFWEDESMCEQFIDENEGDLIWFFTEYRR